MSHGEEIEKGYHLLLKSSGYSSTAIDYFLRKVNVGVIEDVEASSVFTGPCGDSMKIYLNVGSDVITDAKFQVIGCAAAYASGSAVTEIVKGKTLREAKEITEKDIINRLDGLPDAKFHCTSLAIRTLRKAIERYEEK